MRLWIPVSLLLALACLGFSAGLPAPGFYKDVRPILQKHCQICHRAGEAAPMPLTSYGEVRPWAKAIRTAVLTGQMPPWHADSHYGKFKNDPSLSLQEKNILTTWIDAGAKEGPRGSAPPPSSASGEWNIRTPDAVFQMPMDFSVPAQGAIDYQYITVPTQFTEDRWVEMAEVRPGNRSVVHHAIVVVHDVLHDPNGNGSEEYLAGYAPGMTPQVWKPGQARLIRAGSILEFQMHYTANGKPATDRTRIGLVFAKSPPAERIFAMQAMYPPMVLPPREPKIQVNSSALMRQDVNLVGMRAHMHLRGKSFQFRAVYPTGETEILLNIPNFNFDYQPYYYLDTPKFLPRGTRIECTAIYDNSAANPRNPDPSATVSWGPQTWDEMMIGWLDVSIPVR